MFLEKLKSFKLSKLDWPYLASWAVVVAAMVIVMIWQLAGLTSGRLSSSERISIAASSTWHNMLINSLFLPYKIVEWLLLQIGASHVFVVRFAPVIFAVTALLLFLSICRKWFNRPTYVLATILFGSSLWLLHFGRLATPIILYTLVPLVIIRLILWVQGLKGGANRYFIAAVVAVTSVISLYVPGTWLLLLLAAIWQRSKIIRLLKHLPADSLALGGAVLGLLLVPLVYSFVQNPGLIGPWIGFSSASGDIVSVLARFYEWPLYIFGYGPKLPSDWWLGRQTLLSVFPAAMALFGAYFYAKNYSLRQSKLLGLLLGGSVALFVLSDGALFGLASGLIFLLAAAGIGYMLLLWRKVFPKNPLAYSGAILLITMITAMTVIYTTRSYFVAWRYNTDTTQAFRVKT